MRTWSSGKGLTNNAMMHCVERGFGSTGIGKIL